MLQQTLFSDPPRARRNDPATSHTAARRALASGLAGAHRQQIAAAIRSRPGMTYRAIAEATGLEPVAVGRRLVEIERDGLAQAGEPRDGMRTWWPR